MEINIELTRQDYVDFNKYCFFKKRLKNYIFFMVVFSILLPLLFYINDEFYLTFYLIEVFSTAIVFSIFMSIAIYFSFKKIERLPAKDGSILGAKKIIIDNDNFIQESDNNKSIQKLKSIKSIELSKKSIFVFIDNTVAYVIPKRFFDNDSEVQNFIKMLKERINAL
jgi:hypothetical protein